VVTPLAAGTCLAEWRVLAALTARHMAAGGATTTLSPVLPREDAERMRHLPPAQTEQVRAAVGAAVAARGAWLGDPTAPTAEAAEAAALAGLAQLFRTLALRTPLALLEAEARRLEQPRVAEFYATAAMLRGLPVGGTETTAPVPPAEAEQAWARAWGAEQAAQAPSPSPFHPAGSGEQTHAEALRLFTQKVAEWGVRGEDGDLPTEADAARYGLRFLTHAETVGALGFCRGPHGCVEITYGDAQGQPTPFKRYRFLGWAGDNKYHQPFKGVRVYHPVLPPATPLAHTYAKGLVDAGTPLGLTEGEGKALRATLAGLKTGPVDMVWVAVGGVNSICSKRDKERGAFLDDALMGLPWRQRHVFLAFDYDGPSASPAGEPKPSVAQAEQLLSGYLTALGALTFAVRLGKPTDTQKVGLDEWVNEHAGPFLEQAWLGLVTAAMERRQAEAALVGSDDGELHAALCDLNTKFFVMSGDIYMFDNLKKMTERQFRTQLANRQFLVKVGEDKDGEPKMARKPLAELWLTWRHRMSAKAVVFRPSEDAVVTADGCFNSWRGFATVPKAGDIGPWLAFKRAVFSNEPALEREFDLFFAHMLQRPWVKQSRIPIVGSKAEGIGKSVLLETPAFIMGIYTDETPFHVARIAGPTTLTSPWTEWLRNSLYVVVNEPGEHGDKQVTQRLKALATNAVLEWNEKFGGKGTVINLTHIAITSNSIYVYQFDEHARREMVHEPRAEHITDDVLKQMGGSWAAFVKWRDEHLGEIMAFYMAMDLGDYDAKSPAPGSAAKARMADAARFGAAGYVCGEVDDEQELFVVPFEIARAAASGVPRHKLDPKVIANALREHFDVVPLAPQESQTGAGQVRVPETTYYDDVTQKEHRLRGDRLRVWVRRGVAQQWKDAAKEAVAEHLLKIYREACGEQASKF
jgi:hypothetical protein